MDGAHSCNGSRISYCGSYEISFLYSRFKPILYSNNTVVFLRFRFFILSLQRISGTPAISNKFDCVRLPLSYLP